MFAGAFARGPGYAVPESLQKYLRAELSRHPEERVAAWGDKHAFVVHADVGAFGAPGFHTSPSGAFTVVAGDPLLGIAGRAPNRTRTEDVALLHEALSDRQESAYALLARSREAFALAHIDPARGTLTLATDRIGLRPIHVWHGPQFTVFASALRVLENCEWIEKTFDFRAFCEISALSVAYDGRTPYQEVRTLRAAEIVRVDAQRIASDRYWRWDAVEASTDSIEALAEQAYAVLDEAIALRRRGDKSVAALLSGGLDSRIIVGLLRARQASVHTVNFAYRNGQSADNVLSRAYADVAQTKHQILALPPQSSSNMSDTLADRWSDLAWVQDQSVERPRLVWHGFDGSFAVGYVHIYPEVVELLRAGRCEDAFFLYLKRRGAAVWVRGLRAPYDAVARDAMLATMNEAYAQIAGEDPGRRFYILHLVHECRGLLQSLYENADLRRMEFHMPLVDPELLRIVLSAPVDEVMGHKFYMRMLAHAPATLLSVPWQTYPGHEPCPLPRGDLVDQWAHSPAWERVHRTVAAQRLARIRCSPFPKTIVKRRRFWEARLSHFLRRGNYDFAFRDVELLQQYLARTGGRIDMNGTPPT